MGILLNVTWCRVMQANEVEKRKSMGGLMGVGIGREDGERLMDAVLEVRKDRSDKSFGEDVCVVKIYGDKAKQYGNTELVRYDYWNVPRSVLVEVESPNTGSIKKKVFKKKVVFNTEG